MHDLNMIAHLNAKEVRRVRRNLDAKADEAELEYTQTDMDESTEEARNTGMEEGQIYGYDDGHESGWNHGWEEGREAGRDEAEEEFGGAFFLVDLLRNSGIDAHEPVTVVYDAALKALVYTQGEFTVMQS